MISREQAIAAGLTRRQIDRQLGSGEWLRVRPSVYRAYVVPPTPEVLRSAVHLELTSPGRGIGLIDRAKQQRWVSMDALELAFRRNKGTWGTQDMRRLLDRTGDRAHSELERLGVELLRAAGITGFVVNLRTTLSSGRPVEFDIGFKERRFAIELDGYAYHSGPDAHRADVRRANEIMADGWVIRRFTYTDLLNDPEGFIATVLEVLVG